MHFHAGDGKCAYSICILEAQEIIPQERNVQEHDHKVRGHRQDCIDLGSTEDRSVLGRDDGSQPVKQGKGNLSPETEGNDTRLLPP